MRLRAPMTITCGVEKVDAWTTRVSAGIDEKITLSLLNFGKPRTNSSKPPIYECSSLAAFADVFYLPSEPFFSREIALQPELRSPESLALPKSCFKDIEGLKVLPTVRARPFFYPMLRLLLLRTLHVSYFAVRTNRLNPSVAPAPSLSASIFAAESIVCSSPKNYKCPFRFRRTGGDSIDSCRTERCTTYGRFQQQREGRRR